MKLVKILSLSLALLLGGSCQKDKPEKCCPGATTEYTVGDGKIYIPNIFTPNFDGINDAFLPYAGIGIESFKEFTIKDRDGNLLHFADEFQPFDFEASWVPTSIYIGKFTYSLIAVSTDGTEKKIKGVANSNLFDLENSNRRCDCTDCQFATQHDGLGRFDESLPSLENICQ